MIDIDSKGYDGRTPLSWAAQKGHEAIVKLLLEIGRKSRYQLAGYMGPDATFICRWELTRGRGQFIMAVPNRISLNAGTTERWFRATSPSHYKSMSSTDKRS